MAAFECYVRHGGNNVGGLVDTRSTFAAEGIVSAVCYGPDKVTYRVEPPTTALQHTFILLALHSG